MAARSSLVPASLRSIASAVTRRVRGQRPVTPAYVDPMIEIVRKGGLGGASRQHVAKGPMAGYFLKDGIWYPITRPQSQVLLTDTVWIIGAAVDRVVEEVTKNGGDWTGKFGAKCVLCGAEYEVEPDVCDAEGCFSTEFRSPDPAQLDRINEVVERPNWDNEGRVVKTWNGILEDLVFYDLTIAGWHWEVVYGKDGRPSQVWPMNSEWMRRVDDPGVRIGKWFCPECLRDPNFAVKKATFSDGQKGCPIHGDTLEKVGWIEIDQTDNIVQVWSAREVLGGTSRTHGYRIYARSKVLRVWAMGQIIRWRELFTWAAFSGNKRPDNIVIWPLTQSEVDAMIEEFEKFKEDHPEYQSDIHLGIGNGESKPADVKLINLMGDLARVDEIEYDKWVVEAVAINLGVSRTMMGQQEAGQLGHPEEVLQVSYDTIQEHDRHIEEFVNNGFVPLFPEVTDWEWKQNPPAKEQETERAETAKAWFEAIKAGRDAGARVKLDPTVDFGWPIVIEGWDEKAPAPAGSALGSETPVSPGDAPPQTPRGEAQGPPGAAAPEDGLPPALEGGAPKSTVHNARKGRQAAKGGLPGHPGALGGTSERGAAVAQTKALTPRSLPPAEAPPGIREFEDRLAERLGRLYDKAVRDLERRSGRPATRSELEAALTALMLRLRDSIAREGARAALDAYVLGMDAQRDEFPLLAFGGRDEAVLNFLEAHPEALAGALSKVIEDAHGIIAAELRRSFQAGVDTGSAIRAAAETLREQKWRVERVVRTETTRVVNTARATQYEKYAPPDSTFDWIPSTDRRLCERCAAIAARNPWPTLDELKAATGGFAVHPNCRCTMVRHVEA